MVVFRVEVTIPKNLDAVKRSLLQDERLHTQVYEQLDCLGKSEELTKDELTNMLLKTLAHTEIMDIKFLVGKMDWADGSVTVNDFKKYIENYAVLESKKDLRSVVRNLAHKQCTKGFQTAEAYVETESVNHVTFHWNTTGDGADRISRILQRERIALDYGSGTYSLFPVALARPSPVDALEDDEKKGREERERTAVKATERVSNCWKNYQDYTMKGRRPPFEVLDEIENSVELDFNFMGNLYGAAVIAGVGLAVNSAVMVVASMLISPLMGPILGVIFGFVVRKYDLLWHSLWGEIKSVLHTVFAGFLLGIFLGLPFAEGLNWPTSEMAGRGTLSNFISGVFFAVASGVILGVNVSTANGNALAGVAISASLLPPLVNTGMCLGFAAVADTRYENGDNFSTDLDQNEPPGRFHTTSDDVNYVGVGWRKNYRADVYNFLNIAGMSFALYIMNFVVIFVICLIIFKLKKYGPEELKYHSEDAYKSDLDSRRSKFRDSISTKGAAIGGNLLEKDSSVRNKVSVSFGVSRKLETDTVGSDKAMISAAESKAKI